ncbi:MAG: hypothetical protein WBB55_03910 [Anaerolineales bacterium]
MPRPTGSCTKAGAPGSLPWGGCGAPSVIPTRQWNSPWLQARQRSITFSTV